MPRKSNEARALQEHTLLESHQTQPPGRGITSQEKKRIVKSELNSQQALRGADDSQQAVRQRATFGPTSIGGPSA